MRKRDVDFLPSDQKTAGARSDDRQLIVVSPPPGGAKGRTQQITFVPTKPAEPSNNNTSAPRPLRRRQSLISQKQRDALTVSAFGFGTTRRGQPDKSAAVLQSGLATSAGNMGDVVVSQDEKSSVRFHLCVDALSEGCIMTFIHLFQLSHRDPVCVDELAQTFFKISDERLDWVKEQLSAIEVARRQSEFRATFERFQALADFFEKERDYDEAAWHYDTALRYAMESLDRVLEQEVRVVFAAFFERRKQYARARDLYEVMYKLAVALGDEKTALEASFHLMRIYQALGEELKRTNLEDAKYFFDLTVSVAKRVGSAKDEALAYHALGCICEQMGDHQKALKYQQAFLDVSQRAGLVENERKAALAVASLQERMNLSSEAMESLQRALVVSNGTGDLEGVCHATMQLGKACKSSGNEEKAIQYFRLNFQAACRQRNQDLEDQARVALGFALGEHYFKHAGAGRGYVPIICNDVKAQLAWMSEGIL